jgi:pimeloyl-ACP methyl ester carboxylesterase
VIAPDLRGHGLSGKTDDGHTLARYARDIHYLLESLDYSDVTLVGWSMGTHIALSYVEQFGPDRLDALVLVDMSPYFYSEDGWDYPLFGEFAPEGLEDVVENLRTNRSAFVKEILATAFFVETPSKETIDEMYAESAKTPTSVAVAMMEAMSEADFRDVVDEIDVPTLLVYGGQSGVFPGNVGQWMEDHIPDSELVTFEESSHCPFWEEPERFNGEVAAFVG